MLLRFSQHVIAFVALTTLDFVSAKLGQALYERERDTRVAGGTKVDGRIVGGTPVGGPSVYPFFVNWNRLCGGSLIHPEIVMTAAHCNTIVTTEVIVGAFELGSSTTSGAEARNIAKRIPHPQYSSSLLINDVMLLKLDSPVTTIAPIPLNENDSVPAVGENVTIIGLGQLSENSNEQPSFLREVTVGTFSDQACAQAYAGVHTYTPGVQFCAGVTGGGKDSCQGDSGGPVFTSTTSGQVDKQVGIVSWGLGCARPGKPGVNAQVSAFRQWIKDVICQEVQFNRPSDCPAPTPSPTHAPPGEGQAAVDVNLFTDNYPIETGWSLKDTANNTVIKSVAQGSLSDQLTLHTTRLNLDIGRWYTFEITDSFSDGICCAFGGGSYWIQASDVRLVTGNGIFTDVKQETFVVPHIDTSPPGTSEPGPGEIGVRIDIFTDDFPREIAWTLGDNTAGGFVASSPLANYTGLNELVSNSVVLQSGSEYNFTITDKAGDGLCCEYGMGNYSLVTGEVVLASGAEYGDFETTIFVAPAYADTLSCFDTTNEFLVDSRVGNRGCEWLKNNTADYPWLCAFVDVAVACPVTCDVCDYLSDPS